MDNLDTQDKAIVEALAAGKTDEEIMSEFGVDQAKVDALRGVAAGEEAPSGDTEPSDEGDSAEGEGDTTPEGEETPA